MENYFGFGLDAGVRRSVTSVTLDATDTGPAWSTHPDRFYIGDSNGAAGLVNAAAATREAQRRGADLVGPDYNARPR